MDGRLTAFVAPGVNEDVRTGLCPEGGGMRPCHGTCNLNITCYRGMHALDAAAGRFNGHAGSLLLVAAASATV
jgi:hypothetical protein